MSKKQDYLLYDCETKNVPYTGGSKIEGINYANGWGDFENLGVSCICTFTYSRGYEVFLEEDLGDFQKLADSIPLVFGFNSSRFDDKLLAANGIKIETRYDLLNECWRAVGLDPNYSFPKTASKEQKMLYSGFKLEWLAISNLAMSKRGHGALAPVKWQRGEYAEVIKYCFRDVYILRSLVNLGLSDGLWMPKFRKKVKLLKPSSLPIDIY